MKKVLWVIGGLFIALLVAIVSIPLFVNVDQYRPTITAEVNKRINGEFELGKLNLSLWGAIKIHAESITLSVNGFPGKMVEAQKFHLEIPFSSIFAGEPQVVAVLKEPKITVLKDKDGKTNALFLMKSDEAAQTPTMPEDSRPMPTGKPPQVSETPVPGTQNQPESQPPVAAAPAEPGKVPALIAGAKLGLKVEKGNLSYTDALAGSEYQVNGLELEAKNLGLGSTMSFRALAPLKGKTASFSFEGPVEASGELQPILVGSNVKSARGDLNIDATKLALDMPGKFRKPAGMAFVSKLKIEGNESETLLRQIEVQFHQYRLHGKGRVTTTPVTVKVDVTVEPMRLDQLQDFVPMLAPYALKGSLTLNAGVDMTPEAFRLTGDLKATDGSFFMKDVLRSPMQFQLQAGFSENNLNLTRATLTGPESDLQLVGQVKNFLAPQFAFSLIGKSLNVDKLLPDPPPAAAKEAALFFREALAAPPAKGDINPMAALAANPIVMKAAGELNAQIGKVVVKGTTLEQVTAKAQLKNMSLNLRDASLKTFGGTVKSNGTFDLKSPGLNFKSQGKASGVSGQQAFAVYFPKYKNTLEGTFASNWDVSGAAYPAATRVRSLKGSAKLMATDGALKSVDFQESINGAFGKIPFLKGKKPVQVDNGFKSMTANLTFSGGVVTADPIEILPKGKGFIVKGKSTIQESMEQESFFDVFDPQGLLPKEIQQAGKPTLALRLYGPITGPKTDYGYTAERLASNAGKNALKNAADKALEKFIGNQDGAAEGGKQDALKDAADKLRKKFKF